MAFLCPVRIRRDKRKKDVSDKLSGGPSIGRITGSASIETLVRVGIEKEHGLSPDSKMVVLHDFTPCVDDELQVLRGHSVNLLYQENDWVYVIAEDGREGFIPHSYCAPYGSHLADLALTIKHKKLPRSSGQVVGPELEQQSIDSGQHSESESCGPDVHPFLKDPSGGRFVVLYTFVARDENDVSVERGEVVTVLNREDHDWFWIVRSDGQEGFVPSAFVYPADVIREHAGPSANTQQTAPTQMGINQPQLDDAPPPRFHGGSELVMLYDYKAQAPDDLSVRRGDWVYADLSNQTVEGWLWTYAPKTRKYGFIPKAYARPPAMTSL